MDLEDGQAHVRRFLCGGLEAWCGAKILAGDTLFVGIDHALAANLSGLEVKPCHACIDAACSILLESVGRKPKLENAEAKMTANALSRVWLRRGSPEMEVKELNGDTVEEILGRLHDRLSHAEETIQEIVDAANAAVAGSK